MPGYYVRTETIKAKQRQKMLIVAQTMDYDAVDRKRKATIKRLGIKVGRRKGEGPKKTGWMRNCVVCANPFWVIPCRAKTRVCSKKCLFKDPAYLKKLKAVDHSYQRQESWGVWAKKSETPAFRRYSNKVHKLSDKTYRQNISTINPKGHPRTLCGVDGGWQLDHIIPIRECFDRGITPTEASGLVNLRMLPWRHNLMRSKKCP